MRRVKILADEIEKTDGMQVRSSDGWHKLDRLSNFAFPVDIDNIFGVTLYGSTKTWSVMILYWHHHPFLLKHERVQNYQ